MTESRALVMAGALHLALLLLLSIAVHRAPPPLAEGDVIPVSFVDVGPVTTTPSPAAPSAPAPPSPLPAEPEPVLASEPEPLPPAPVPQPPEPVRPAPQPKVSDTAIQDRVPAEKASAPSSFDAGALETLIDRSIKKPPARTAQGNEAGARGNSAGRPDPRAMATLEAAIRSQIAPCWNPPAGGQDVKDMTVVLKIRLNRDGSLAAPPEFVSQTGATDANSAYARAFVETARRAVLRCSPLELPANLYAQWREFELNFDPRMLT